MAKKGKRKDKEQDAVAKVVNAFNEANNYRQEYEEKWLRFYQLYRNYQEHKKPNGANLFIPYVFSIIETLVPKIVSLVFASRPYIGYLPLNRNSIERAKNMEALVDYQLVQKIRFISVATEWIKDALIYGTGIIKVGWAYEEREVVEAQPLMRLFGKGYGKLPKKIKKVVRDEPIVECIDPFDFYVEPGARDICDAKYCIHRTIRSKSYLKRMEKQGVYKNIDAIEEATPADLGFDQRASSIGENVSNKKGVELLEYWEDDRLITVANRAVVIRDEPNPFWLKKKPFIKIVDTIDPHNFYGIGEIEPIEHLQHELNTIRNMRMDNINLIINRMWTVKNSADISPEELISRPGGVIHVQNHDDIQPIKLDNVAAESYKEDELIRRDIDLATGVNDYVRGTNPDRRETATTASVLSTASNERIKLKATLLEDTGIGELGVWLAALNRQFIDRPYVIRLLGEDSGVDFREITHDDINGDFDVIALGSSVDPVVNKTARLNSLIQLYSIFQNNQYINQYELTKRILEVADIKDAKVLMLQPEQPQQQAQPQAITDVGLAQGMTGLEDEMGRLVNG